MKVKYSPDFAAAFHKLPPHVQAKVKTADWRIMANDLGDFDRQGWAYFLDLDDEHVAVASIRKNEDVFYWLMIVSPDSKPAIL